MHILHVYTCIFFRPNGMKKKDLLVFTPETCQIIQYLRDSNEYLLPSFKSPLTNFISSPNVLETPARNCQCCFISLMRIVFSSFKRDNSIILSNTIFFCLKGTVDSVKINTGNSKKDKKDWPTVKGLAMWYKTTYRIFWTISRTGV